MPKRDKDTQVKKIIYQYPLGKTNTPTPTGWTREQAGFIQGRKISNILIKVEEKTQKKTRNTKVVQHKSNQLTLYWKRERKKKHPNTSIDAKNVFSRSYKHSCLKTIRKSGIEEDFLNLIKGIYEKSTAEISSFWSSFWVSTPRT